MTKLIEYGPAKTIIIDERTASEIDIASNKWKSLLGLRSKPLILNKIGKNAYRIEAKGVAGFVSFNQVSFEIIPKFLSEEELGSEWKLAMWNFFLYGAGLNIFGTAKSSIESLDGIIDLLAYSFVKEFKKSFLRGFPFEYKSNNVYSASIKGKLNTKKYHKLLPVTGKIDQIQTFLSQETSVATLLKWTCSQLMNNVSSGQLRQQLSEISTQIPTQNLTKPRNFETLTAKRSSPHLSTLIDIAKVIYDDKNLSFGNSEIKIPGFLWNSHDLFEKVIFRLFKESLLGQGLSIEKSSQRMLHPDDGKYPVNTVPDIRVVSGGSTQYLVDAKYKVLKNQPKTEDVYQVLAGGRVNSLEEVCLIYPGNGDPDPFKTYHLNDKFLPYRVMTYKVNLGNFSSSKNIAELRKELSATFLQKVLTDDYKVIA
ncbi:5-methylcytosine restriction system specificity protein McrC [Alteromonas australica]|uniref:5-methylcytosine restriction system specificity protein McrC n=1 Tax=Alteromonas australica TaxID=589873 RepID=UPI0035C7B48D